MTDRSRFCIISIGSLHTGWALKVDGIIRRTLTPSWPALPRLTLTTSTRFGEPRYEAGAFLKLLSLPTNDAEPQRPAHRAFNAEPIIPNP